MKKIILALAIGTFAAGTALSAVNVRQLNQQRRIDAGVRSGKLTHGEAGHLKAEQRYVTNLEKSLRARHGGHLTDGDKAVIHAKQDRIDRLIIGKKHNARRGENKLKL